MGTIRESWASFPLFPFTTEPGKPPRCACRAGAECARVGKHPRVRWGELGKGEHIEGPPDTIGHGIATGERSGIIVLDFDTIEALEALAETRDLPSTYMVRTPRGCHMYYEWPGFYVPNSQSKLAPKVDVRGDGGFVVAPGSAHKSGGAYEPLDEKEDVAPCPEWLVEWVKAQSKSATVADLGAGENEPTDSEERRAAFTAWLEREPPCVSGEGGQTQLLKVCLKGVRFFALPLNVVEELVRPYNERCEPPWSEAEIAHKLGHARDRVWTTWPWNAFGIAGEFVDMMSERPWEATQREEAATARAAAPVHEYTYDPLTERRQPRTYQTKDGSTKVAGLVKAEFGALVMALQEDDSLHRVFRLNEFDRKIYAIRPPMRLVAERGVARFADGDVDILRKWLEDRKDMTALRDDLTGAVGLIASRHTFHPVKDWIEALPAPTTRHLDTLATVLFGDERPEAQQFVRKQLIASVARLYHPGEKVDSVLTLMGDGGYKKTTLIEALYRVPGYNVFRTDLPDLRNMQAIGQAGIGIWAVELAELDCVKKADEDAVKSFLTRREDRYSPKYVSNEVCLPRTWVAWASTNDETFLPRHDMAFRRRFWPIRVSKKVDMAWVDAHQPEIWSEALAAWRAGGPELFWFEDERAIDAAKAAFVTVDSWEEPVRRALEQIRPNPNESARNLTTHDVWRMLPGGMDKLPTNADSQHIAKVLSQLGLEKKRTRHGFVYSYEFALRLVKG